MRTKMIKFIMGALLTPEITEALGNKFNKAPFEILSDVNIAGIVYKSEETPFHERIDTEAMDEFFQENFKMMSDNFGLILAEWVKIVAKQQLRLEEKYGGTDSQEFKDELSKYDMPENLDFDWFYTIN